MQPLRSVPADLPDLGLPWRKGDLAPRFDHELGHADSSVAPRGESRPREGVGLSGLRPVVDLPERGVYPEGFAEPVVRELIPDDLPHILEAHQVGVESMQIVYSTEDMIGIQFYDRLSMFYI